jgi:hypothetical protein
MAINYLNNIDLNKNQLLQGVIENQPNDAAAGSSPVTGQIYYNTTDNVLKQYNGSAWTSIAGDITEVQGGTYISVTDQAGPIPIVNHDSTTRTDTSSSASPGYGATFTAVDSVTSNATGHITALNLKTVTMPSAEAYTFNVTGDSGTNQVINSGNTVDIAGGTNINTVVGATDTVTVNLDDSINLAGTLDVTGIATFNDQANFDSDVSITGDLDMNQAKIIDLATPTVSTDAATKGYVDQAVTGALSYQGGYNAATNTPNLDSNPSPNPIKKGWTYTVTADGSFFTEQVRVGDVLIAEQDAPTTLANWTTVQNNVDLADLTTVGIGNVNAGTGISVAYSNGTATVANTDTNSSNTHAATIASGSMSGSFIHSLNTRDVIVQLYDTVTYETVYADVDRIATNQISVSFGAQLTNAVRVLVQKIG